jgi:hypothetical protein
VPFDFYQIVIGSFKQDISKELNLKRKTSAESSTSSNVVITGDHELERVTAAVMPIQAIDLDGSCITPTSGLWGPNNREGGNVNVAYQNMNHTPLRGPVQNVLPLQMSYQRMSPDFNNSLP